MSEQPPLTHASGAPVVDNLNIQTAGPRGPALLQDIWLIEKLAHFDREVIPERSMHAKGWGAYGSFTVTHDITRFTKAKIFSEIGKKTDLFMRFSSVAGERGAADAERDSRGDDHYEQPGNLFRKMSPGQQQLLFENTARAMGDARLEVKLRHVANCAKADPDYGAGVARALGLEVAEAAE